MTIADTFRHLGLSAPDPRSDGELLTRFVAVREETAFAELLRRHGPTVYGVCRRVLANAPDADDAFQAVFLVLARKADAVRPPGMVGNWLYGVAVRTANKARVMNAKRRARDERAATARERESPNLPPGGRGSSDTLAVIDAELAALPDVYRAAFVTCELNGRSRSEASRELGWPEGTVAARLAKARELLAARLTKRGVTLGVGLFAAAVVPAATAAEAMSAVRELIAVGTANAVAPAAQTLSDEVAKTMTTNPAKWLVLGGLVLALAGGGAVLLAAPGDKPIREQIKAPVPKAVEAEWQEGKPIELEDSGRITGVAVSADGKLLAITQDGKLTVLAADTRKKQYEAKYQEPATLTAVAFNPKGDKLAVTVKDGVHVCVAATGRGTESWQVKGFDPHQVIWFADKGGGEHLVATNGEVTNRPDSNRAEDGFKGWAENRHKPCVLAPVPGKEAWLMRCQDPDEKVASDEFEFAIRVWNTDPTKRCRLEGHKQPPTAAAVTTDGKRMVTADVTGQVIVWDAESCKEQSRVKLTRGVQRLAFAPDGKTLAVVLTDTNQTLQSDPPQWDGDLELYLIDVTDPPKDPKPLWRSEREAHGYLGQPSITFSSDGKTLLAAFGDTPEGRAKAAKSFGVKVWELVPKK